MQSESRPEPVMNAAAIGGLISAFLVALRLMGWLQLNDEQYNAWMRVINDAITVAVPFLAPMATAWWIARPRVTPVSDPQDDNGNRLVPMDGAD